ncbi:tol-pal system YbgF family protein [Bacteroidota bacterium]
MAKKKTGNQGDKSLGNIESALSRTELFIEDNQKLLTNILLVVLVIVFAVIAGNRYILKPKNLEAASSMYIAERYFERDSFNLALNGYGTYPGFLDIIDEYKITKAAKLAKYYAGICYKELGDAESAIDYLSKFSTKDIMIGSAAGSSLGDAYSNLGEYNKAVKAYLEAADKYENEFTTPIILKKAGLVYEKMGDFEEAKEVYERLENSFPDTAEGREMQKYIGRVSAKISVL